MKISKLAIATAVAGLLSCGSAFAQQRETGAPTRRAATYQEIADEYDSYYADSQEAAAEPASPSDAAAAAEPAAGDAHASHAGDSSCCGGEGCSSCCDRDAFKLFDSPTLDCWGVDVGGWVAQGYTWNPDRPADRFNGPVTYPDRSNEYQLNQAWLYVDRPTDTGGCGSDLGGRIDVMYGTGHRFTTSTGLETFGDGTPRWNNDHRFYGLALPQAYAEVAYNDVKVKMGHFISPVGYFTVGTAYNFFQRLPHTYQHGEPFTHTGMLATYQATDNLSLGAGVIRGWDNWDTGNPHAGYLGTATLTGDNGSSLAYVQVFTRERAQTGAFTNRYLQTVVYTRPINKCLTYVFQSDYGWQNNALANGNDAKWFGMNSYWFYKVSDCLTWGLNTEWFRDQGGFRVGGFLPTTDGGSLRGLSTARSGYDGTFYQMTFGPNIRPHGSKNLLIRPSMSLDWYDGQVNNAGGLRPFDDGANRSQWILATDVVWTF